MPSDDTLDRGNEPPASGADLHERLVRVFEATFPDLPEAEIPTASIDTVRNWDSLQSLTLVALLEEEFGVSIAPFDLVDLVSFDAIGAYLLRALAAS